MKWQKQLFDASARFERLQPSSCDDSACFPCSLSSWKKLIAQLYSLLTIWITWIACKHVLYIIIYTYIHARIPVLFWISSAVTWTYCIRKNYFHLALSWHSIPISGLFSPPKIPGRLKAGASSAVLTRKKKVPARPSQNQWTFIDWFWMEVRVWGDGRPKILISLSY